MIPNKHTLILIGIGMLAGYLLADVSLIAEPALGKAADGTGGFQPFAKLFAKGYTSGSGQATNA